MLLAVVAACAAQPVPDGPVATFGTTVVGTSGLRGEVYAIPRGQQDLPSFRRLKKLGVIYTTSLRVPSRPFNEGFPGVTERKEWFAIDYTGRFWVETGGVYRFRLLSDDGAKLLLNRKVVIDNDGTHPPLTIEGSAHLTRGIHQIRVPYFQGPRFNVALVLSVAGPDGGPWRIFDTEEFRPPADPGEWINGKISKVKQGSNW